jgi:hypothetical protein
MGDQNIIRVERWPSERPLALAVSTVGALTGSSLNAVAR